MKKTAQQIQDQIFRKMSADQKVRLGSCYWQIAKIIFGVDRIYSKSEKEVDKIHSAMAIIQDQLDFNYLRKWAKKQNTLKLLEEQIGLVSSS